MEDTISSQAGPLRGVTVVELAGLGPAQLGTMMLADMGAAVTRVDRPADVPRERPEADSPELLARGRRSVALDLKSAAGRELLEGLLASADVLIDPYRPGVLERLGLVPERLSERNPRLVIARMTGWGQTGPLAGAAGHDIDYIALAGALAPIGDPDRPPPVPLALVGDFGGGGMLLAFGVAAALLERERSGRGQVIDVAMVDGIAALMTAVFQLDAGGQWARGRGANWLQGAAPWYRAYRTADDRHVAVGALEPQFYRALLEALGREPDRWPQWERARWRELAERLQEVFLTARREEWVARLAGIDCCFAPVLEIDEVAEHAHLAARGTYLRRGGVVQPAPAPRFERTPGAIASAPPWPGSHSAQVLAELGVGEERLAELLAAGTVAVPPGA